MAIMCKIHFFSLPLAIDKVGLIWYSGMTFIPHIKGKGENDENETYTHFVVDNFAGWLQG